MRLYLEVARRSFARFAVYRGAVLGGVFTNTVFGMIHAYVLLAVYEQRDSVNGFDAADAVTFVFGAQAMLMVVRAFGWEELANQIRTGDIASDLQRPADIQAWWMAQFLGMSAFFALFRGLPPFFGGWLVFDEVSLPSPATTVSFIASAALAAGVAAAYWFLVNVSAFWLVEIRGLIVTMSLLVVFFGGIVIPLWFMPDALLGVSRLTPWAAMVQLPGEVLIGSRDLDAVLRVFGLQAFWLIALTGVGTFVLRRATSRLVVQGG